MKMKCMEEPGQTVYTYKGQRSQKPIPKLRSGTARLRIWKKVDG